MSAVFLNQFSTLFIETVSLNLELMIRPDWLVSKPPKVNLVLSAHLFTNGILCLNQ